MRELGRTMITITNHLARLNPRTIPEIPDAIQPHKRTSTTNPTTNRIENWAIRISAKQRSECLQHQKHSKSILRAKKKFRRKRGNN